MTIRLSSKGGGGALVVQNISIGNQAAAASSGVLFTETPSAGKRIVITGLAPEAGTESNIEIKLGTRVVYTGGISDAPGISTLTILNGFPNSTGNEYLGVGTINQLVGGTNEVLTITKTAGSTAVTVHFSFIETD